MAKVVPKEKVKDSDDENSEPESFTQEQVDAQIAEALAEQRTELETTISELGEELQTLKDDLKEAQKRKAKSGSEDDEVDLQEAITQAVRAARKEWDKAHGKELTKLQQQMNALSEENKSKKVQDWKAELVEAYEGQVIPALIKGDTREELEASAEASHETWLDTMKDAGVQISEEEDEESEEDDEENESDSSVNEVNEEDDEEDEDEDEEPLTKRHSKAFSESAGVRSARIKKKKSQPVTIKSQARAIIVPNPGSVNGGVRRNEPDAKLKGVRGLSMSEYRKRRESILAATRSRYGGVRS
jgi:hypothetical protein